MSPEEHRALTPEERRRLVEAPVTVGVLATHTYGGSPIAGNGGPKEPVLGKYGRITGWKAAKGHMQ